MLYRDIRTINDCQTLQDDLSTIAEWSNIWQLIINFNISKCKVMCITNKKLTPTFNYRINNTTLEWVTVFKYLELLIDNKLKWNDQTNHAVAKATKILNLLRETSTTHQKQRNQEHFQPWSGHTLSIQPLCGHPTLR